VEDLRLIVGCVVWVSLSCILGLFYGVFIKIEVSRHRLGGLIGEYLIARPDLLPMLVFVLLSCIMVCILILTWTCLLCLYLLVWYMK
jgi:hypothetical protein